MNPHEKNSLLNLLGAVYGETKKMDEMIVGQAKDLKRSSDEIKNTFQQVLQSNHAPQPPQHQPVAVQPQVFAQDPVVQHIQQPAVVQPAVTQNNDQILIEISNKLSTIIELLQKKKHKKNATKNTKTRTKKIPTRNIESKSAVYSEITESGIEYHSQLS